MIIQITAAETVSESTSNKLITGTGRLNEEIHARPLYQQVGFTSLPRANSRHVGIIEGNIITIVAGTDTENDRPVLTNAGDCAIYANKTVYIKLEDSGDITIDNGSGKIVLQSNGQININDGNLTVDP